MVNSDGKASVDVTKYSTTYNSFAIDFGIKDGWFNKTWSYYGYKSLDNLYKDVVTSNADSCNHEDNVKE